MRDYTAEELCAPGTGLRLKYVFCDHPHTAVLRGGKREAGAPPRSAEGPEGPDTPDSDEGEHEVPESVRKSEFQAAVERNKFLRFEKGVAAFAVYPKRKQDVMINRILWETVRDSVYDPTKGNTVIKKNIFCLGFPDGLYSFLQELTWEKLNAYIVHLLAIHYSILTRDMDVEGMRTMRQELLPEIWSAVDLRIKEAVASQTNSYDEVIKDLKSLFMLPWKISVYGAFWSKDDMDSAMDEDDLLVPSSVTDGGPSKINNLPIGSPWSSTHWDLYKDWTAYSELFCKRMQMPSGDALTRMDTLISERRQEDVFHRIHTLLLCAHRDESILSTLPDDVIQAKVAPLLAIQETNGAKIPQAPQIPHVDA